jgi:hypothetical protein
MHHVLLRFSTVRKFESLHLRAKHPEFQGIMCVMREVADLIKADERGDAEDVKRQALHVAITAIRLYNGE